MSSENPEENAQGDIATGITLHSPKPNKCPESVQNTLNNMDISESNNPTSEKDLQSADSEVYGNYRLAGLENVKKDDIPIGNEKKSDVADGSVDENLLAKVKELDISQNKTVDVELFKTQGTSAQDPMSLSFETFLKFSSKLADNTNEDFAKVKMKRIGFLGKGDYEDESIDSELDSESESDYDSEDEDKAGLKNIQNTNIKKRKVQEESWLSVLGYDKLSGELPDISTLGLNNKEEFMHMGNLECVIDKIVTIAGLPDLPAYDLDTLLFLDEGQKVLGYVFDVMGPVSAPVYIVHMNSVEAIKNLQIQKGTKVYCAPKSKYTKYVFLQELMKMRGSDAAWSGEAEVPLEYQDCSDEEHDARSKVSKREGKRHYSHERYRKFVSDMNRANERDTRLHRMADTHRLHERMAGVQSIEQQMREHKLRNQRSGSSNQPPEVRRGRSHFRNNAHGVGTSLSELQNWSAVTSNLPNLGSLLASSPTFDPSIPPPNIGTSSRLLVTSGGSVFPPFFNLPPQNVNRSGGSNRSTNRPNLRQNSMPGPSNEGWFD